MLKKIPHETSAVLLTAAMMSDEALAVLEPNMPPETVLDLLATAETVLDFLRFFAHAVPPREGICWALAVIAAVRPAATTQESDALEQVADWLRDPSETRRRHCMALGEALGYDAPIGWLCLAVGWSGAGSIVAPDLPEVMPPVGLHAKAIFGATALCLPDHAEARIDAMQMINDLARKVAAGAWPGLYPEADG